MSQSAAWLVAARVVQGVGAAVLAPSTLALLQTNFAEGTQRTRAVGYYGATAGVGASIGLVLGGVLADMLSWRVGFFLNLPIGLALMLASRRYLVEAERRSGRFDMPGALASTAGMAALVYGTIRAATSGWSDPLTVAALLAGVALLAAFVMIERRAPQPIMPLRLFANGARNGAYAARFLFLGAMLGFWFFTTQLLQGVLGYSAFVAGLAFLPTALLNFGVALAVPRLTRRFGNGHLLASGMTLALVGMAWLAWASVHAAHAVGVALPMMLIGAGQGCTLGPLTVAGIAGVAPEDAGAAAGIVNVAHQIGASLGLAVLTVVFTAAGTGGSDAPAQLAYRICAALTGSTAMLGLSLILVLILIVRPLLQGARKRSAA